MERSGPRAGWRPRSAATALRVAGALVVVGGLLVAARWTPATPPAWRVVERFGFDAAGCAEWLAGRESAPFTVPAGRGEPLPVAELAAWFRLEAGAVCAANAVPAGACPGHGFAPGETAVLPLGRGEAP